MTIKKATRSSLEAVIQTAGRPISLVKFRSSMPKSGAKAAVLQSSGLKKLIMGNIKAFKGPGGQIYQRRSKSRLPIKKLSSNSIPVMIGNEKRVYGQVEPVIESELAKNLEAQINLILSQ